jgi:hypothetical protein
VPGHGACILRVLPGRKARALVARIYPEKRFPLARRRHVHHVIAASQNLPPRRKLPRGHALVRVTGAVGGLGAPLADRLGAIGASLSHRLPVTDAALLRAALDTQTHLPLSSALARNPASLTGASEEGFEQQVGVVVAELRRARVLTHACAQPAFAQLALPASTRVACFARHGIPSGISSSSSTPSTSTPDSVLKAFVGLWGGALGALAARATGRDCQRRVRQRGHAILLPPPLVRGAQWRRTLVLRPRPSGSCRGPSSRHRGGRGIWGAAAPRLATMAGCDSSSEGDLIGLWGRLGAFSHMPAEYHHLGPRGPRQKLRGQMDGRSPLGRRYSAPIDLEQYVTRAHEAVLSSGSAGLDGLLVVP